MITLTGNVLNVYRSPEGTRKDGQKFGGDAKVQLQGLHTLRNGEKQVVLVTLTTKKPADFQKLVGKKISVEVGAFAAEKSVQYFLPDHSQPVEITR